MWNALWWGGVSGSAVLIGALLALFLRIPGKLTGFVMAFGTGVLIGAAAYELLEDSAADGGLMPTIIGFTAGALVFTVFDWLISRKEEEGGGLAIFAGTVLDAIPESIMIGASLIAGQGVSVLLVIAIFISNIPEGLSSTAGLKEDGYGKSKIILLWLGVLVISTLASGGGYLFMDHAGGFTKALIASFAGGGIIAMVSSSMMPEAYKDSGPLTGFIAAMGLMCSLILDQL